MIGIADDGIRKKDTCVLLKQYLSIQEFVEDIGHKYSAEDSISEK